MAYYIRVDNEVVVVATDKNDVKAIVQSMTFDPETKDKKVTVTEE
jgi:hypothetical protein